MYGWIAFMAHWSTELTTIDWKSIFLLLLLRFGNIRIKSHWSILWMRSRILSVCMYDDSESGGQIDLMNSLMSLCRNGLNHRFQWFLFEITAKLNVARERIECVYMSEHASLNCKQNSIQMEWWIQNTQTHMHASTLAHAVTFLNYQKFHCGFYSLSNFNVDIFALCLDGNLCDCAHAPRFLHQFGHWMFVCFHSNVSLHKHVVPAGLACWLFGKNDGPFLILWLTAIVLSL